MPIRLSGRRTASLIGFFSHSKLKKVESGGGTARSYLRCWCGSRRRDLERRRRDRSSHRILRVSCTVFRLREGDRLLSRNRTRSMMKRTISTPNFFRMDAISCFSCSAGMTRAFIWIPRLQGASPDSARVLFSSVCGTGISALWAKRGIDGAAFRCQTNTDPGRTDPNHRRPGIGQWLRLFLFRLNQWRSGLLDREALQPDPIDLVSTRWRTIGTARAGGAISSATHSLPMVLPSRLIASNRLSKSLCG